MMDKLTIMSWLEGLVQGDWRDYHSDSEVQVIAKNALELLRLLPEPQIEETTAKKKYRVPVESLIGHIKTAVDVDPWAKEMAEDLLKMHEPRHVFRETVYESNESVDVCPRCGRYAKQYYMENPEDETRFCPWCGQEVTWE